MRVFATILDNPGEQPHQTRYRDPAVLRDLGYTDLVIYQTTGLSGLLSPQTLADGDLRRWVGDAFENVQRTTAQARAAGLEVWLAYDGLSLASELVGSAMTCINQTPAVLCPASEELLEMAGQCLEGLVAQVEGASGIVLRLGDSDAPKVPYLIGNDIYAPHCARCSGIGRADRNLRMIRFFYDVVVKKLDRRLMVRAWNARPGGMHDSADVCRRVVEQLPDDENLLLSFKFTQTDFWRYQDWNPASLACGDRPVVYELQCQREFEAKGAVPNFQPPLWRDGMPEVNKQLGLADATDRVNVAGLWAWVRGGGWRGPYLSTETEVWVDANVVAVPKLAADPASDPAKLARDWAEKYLSTDEQGLIAAVESILMESAQTVREIFYIGPYAEGHHTPWFPAAHFIQDDQIDAEAAWTMIQHLPEQALDQAVAEKQSAEGRLQAGRQSLQRAAVGAYQRRLDPLLASLNYAESLVRTLRLLLSGMVAYRRFLRKGRDAQLASTAIDAMTRCQNAWVDHTQRQGGRGTASPFDSDNLWDFTQRVIDDLRS